MRVLEGIDIDVIEPFPAIAIGQAAQWMRCYKTLMFGDNGPQDLPEIEAFLRAHMALPQVRTWAVVDKNNLTHTHQDTPLVGFVIFERPSPENGYVHLASNRRAWGTKIAKVALMEQACQLIRDDIFQAPDLQRISIVTSSNNRAAVSLARRLDFQKDGYFRDMGRQGGKPIDMIHFGLLRPAQVESVDKEPHHELGKQNHTNTATDPEPSLQ